MDPRDTYSGGMSAPASTQDERMWGALTHGGAALGWLVSAGLLSLALPILVLIVRGPSSAFVAEQARECLNFQLTVYVLTIVCAIMAIVTAVLLPVPFLLFLIPFLILIYPLAIVWMVIAACRSANGEFFRYPLCLRFV
jgi:uncharacterized Tic20 family protein